MLEGRMMLSMREVAELLGCSPRKVGYLIERGQLPSYKIGQLRRVALEDLNHFLAAHKDERRAQ